MQTFEAYLTLEFYEKFLTMQPSGSYSELNEEERLWHDLHDFLFRKCELSLNISKEALLELAVENKTLLTIIKRYQAGSKITYNSPFLRDIEFASISEFREHGSPWRVYFLDRTRAECLTLEKKFGFLFSTPENAIERWKVCSDRYLTEKKLNKRRVTDEISVANRFDSWKKLKEYAHPINAVVINDSYFLAHENAYPNFFAILINLLNLQKNVWDSPDKPQLDLTIFTQKVYKDEKLEDVAKALRNFVHKVAPQISLNLTIIKCSRDKDEHDRCIITNLFLIQSGNSLDYFEKDRKLATTQKETSISFNSLTEPQTQELARSVLAKLQSIARKTKEQVNRETRIVGSKRNLLWNILD